MSNIRARNRAARPPGDGSSARYDAFPAMADRSRRTRTRDITVNQQSVDLLVFGGVDHLYRNLHRMPALVVPCITGRTDHAPIVDQAGTWGSILPATWSFMLAARLHGLGTCWTTPHLRYEREAAELLGIDYARVMQVALTPVAHTIGTDFRPGPRVPVAEVLHWERW